MQVVPNEKDVNYENFIDRLESEVQRAKRYNRQLSLCVLAVDKGAEADCLDAAEKKVLLKELTQVILSTGRNVDIVVSYSGEGLALILPETTFAKALNAADRIKAAVAGHEFALPGSKLKPLISIGVASFPAHCRETGEFAARALQALSLAQEHGGDRVYSAADL